MIFLYVVIILSGCLCEVITGLRLIQVVVPPYKIRGETALLECQYELKDNTGEEPTSRQKSLYEDSQEQSDQGEALYSVKWYKDNEEFYRYLPKASPPQHSYRVDGIRVDHQLSDSSKVTLRSVTLKSSGLYRCEVSAEAPSFASTQGEGRMEVVYLPRDGPHISGAEQQYQIGDTLNLNCTSGKSHPASVLHWFINDEPVTNQNALIHYSLHHHPHGLVTSTLGLEFNVDGRHFRDGEMRVKCVANISPILWQGDRESVVQRRQPLMENREAMLLVRSRAPSKSIVNYFLTIFLLIFLICSKTQ